MYVHLIRMKNNKKIVSNAYAHFTYDAHFYLEICKRYGYNKVATRSLLC